MGRQLALKILLITWGSLGAVRINKSIALVAEKLLDKFDDLYIYHIVGRGNLGVYDNLPGSDRLKTFEFINDHYRYSGAADVVVARGGGNTTAELAVQGKACIIIPNPRLAEGHQIKNAEILTNAGAAIVVDEDDLIKHDNHLFDKISELLTNKDMQKQLSQNISKSSNSEAARSIATLLVTATEV